MEPGAWEELWQRREAELWKLTIAKGLKPLLKQYGLPVTAKRKADYIARLLCHEKEAHTAEASTYTADADAGSEQCVGDQTPAQLIEQLERESVVGLKAPGIAQRWNCEQVRDYFRKEAIIVLSSDEDEQECSIQDPAAVQDSPVVDAGWSCCRDRTPQPYGDVRYRTPQPYCAAGERTPQPYGDVRYQTPEQEEMARKKSAEQAGKSAAAEQVEADRQAAEQAKADREAAEQEEADRQAAEQAKADREAAEQEEADRQAAEQAEADREAAEQEEADRQAAEQAGNGWRLGDLVQIDGHLGIVEQDWRPRHPCAHVKWLLGGSVSWIDAGRINIHTALPPGWIAQYISAEKGVGFVHPRTGQAQWEHPAAQCAIRILQQEQMQRQQVIQQMHQITNQEQMVRNMQSLWTGSGQHGFEDWQAAWDNATSASQEVMSQIYSASLPELQQLHSRLEELVRVRKLHHMLCQRTHGAAAFPSSTRNDDQFVFNQSQSRRNRESAQWVAFKDCKDETKICQEDIPFPSTEALLIKSLSTPNSRKKLYHKMAVRWHPDKFFQKFGSRVKGSELKQIEEKVKGVFQDVTNILQR